MRNSTISKPLALGACVVAAAALAGCTSPTGGRTFVRSTGPATPPPQFFSVQQVNGNWRDTNGNFTAEFRDGQFQSLAPDTGRSVAVGTYQTLGENQVAIAFKTAAGAESSANCTYQPTVMNCRNPDGRTFSMVRT
ncbi:MAG: hypothetical protein AAFY73_00220 [Pseudomonadota bacterium]